MLCSAPASVLLNTETSQSAPPQTSTHRPLCVWHTEPLDRVPKYGRTVFSGQFKSQLHPTQSSLLPILGVSSCDGGQYSPICPLWNFSFLVQFLVVILVTL